MAIKKDNISKFKFCYGCGVCVITCPMKIINLEEGSDGFYSPVIREQYKCIECGLCINVCSFADSQLPHRELPFLITGYAGWSRNPEIRKKCSTGGVIFEITRQMLQRGYRACGVRYNTKLKRAEHFIANVAKEFEPSIGSKYLQSYTTDAFLKLNTKDKFVVIGTPCQIASLREYIKIRKIEENFVLIDFFCHGVPSMNMWRKYLKYISTYFGSSLHDIVWRNKENGWHDSWVMSFKKEGSTKFDFTSNVNAGDLFYEMFLYNKCLNKVCYSSCKFKMENSSADIRVGDLWGSHYADDDRGVNGILALTAKGQEILDSMDTLELVKEPLDVVLEGQMRKGPERDYIAIMDSFLLKTSLNLSTISKINKIVSKILLPLFVIRGKLKQL